VLFALSFFLSLSLSFEEELTKCIKFRDTNETQVSLLKRLNSVSCQNRTHNSNIVTQNETRDDKKAVCNYKTVLDAGISRDNHDKRR
jgi:hypothetical protein